MREEFGDIFDYHAAGKTICITTNGAVKKNGEAVMGRGVALQAALHWPDLPGKLGRLIGDNGNCVQKMSYRVLAFPVKPSHGTSNIFNVVRHLRWRYPDGVGVPGWALRAEPGVIQRSLGELNVLRLTYNLESVYLPRPGCGAGGLDWETQVKPLCEEYGDWLIIVERNS